MKTLFLLLSLAVSVQLSPDASGQLHDIGLENNTDDYVRFHITDADTGEVLETRLVVPNSEDLVWVDPELHVRLSIEVIGSFGDLMKLVIDNMMNLDHVCAFDDCPATTPSSAIMALSWLVDMRRAWAPVRPERARRLRRCSERVRAVRAFEEDSVHV